MNKIRGRRLRSEKQPRGAVVEEGIFSLTSSGFGFVKVEGRDEDVYVPFRKVGHALTGDRVRIEVVKGRPGAGSHKAEGRVLRVLERCTKPHVGVMVVRGNRVWAIVESRSMPYDIRINVASPDDLPEGARHGLKVAVVVSDWPDRSPEPLGRIVDVLGKPGENDTEMHAILATYGLPYRFEPEVEAAACAIPSHISASELEGRRDFRRVTTFTIDPTDAKDFDDALSFKDLGEGLFEVGVHIADVSHYVEPGSVIDKEAYARGTSVYLVDRTVPMLPEALCNNLCSLRPHEDKLCFSAVFVLDSSARVRESWLGHTIINSDYRLDYDAAQDIIDNQRGPLCSEVLEIHRLASALRERRFAEGAISFERPEMKVIVDKNGRPLDVVQKVSRESNWLIEEFMLLANRTVAEFVARRCKSKNPTFVYRIHENPNPEKLESLRSFAHNFGHTMGPCGDASEAARSLNALMKAAKGRPEENALQILALRSMARARYSTDNLGHYGLAFKYYTHFTSPIRRYPDLMVHRLLDMYLSGVKSQDRVLYEEYCEHCSVREQLATDAERESIKLKTVEFMEDKIGCEFEGSVSGLADWGIYVEVEPTHIEGMVALRDIRSDWFEFDEEKYETRGKSSGRVFRLGDSVRVRVLRANTEQKLLDYELCE